MKNCLVKSFDWKGSTIELLEYFKEEPCVFLLDSSKFHPRRGRYSFLGFDPFTIYQTKGKNPFPQLRSLYSKFQQPWSKGLLPLPSGIVGFIGYDAGLYLEKIKLRSLDDVKIPDCFFGFYDFMITVDHFLKKVYVSASGLPEQNTFLRKKRAAARLEGVSRRLEHFFSSGCRDGRGALGFMGFEKMPGAKLLRNFAPRSFEQAVKKALEHIRRGDIYQVNLSQRFLLDLSQSPEPLNPVDLLRRLKVLSPSCFGAYFDAGDFQIVSSSPERFLSLKKRQVQTQPMKGTRPRGKNPAQDQKLRQELLKSEKEQAELLMITDLERNDLGRVCEYGSIQVKDKRRLEAYKTVFQTIATVEGKLAKGKDAFDLLAASFPGGSVTGCPKIRAMEIIEEVESVRRNIYTGALGYINFAGDMDFNVLIRTFLLKEKKVYFHVGSGIVSDSTPPAEYEETLVKAQALRAALQI